MSSQHDQELPLESERSAPNTRRDPSLHDSNNVDDWSRLLEDSGLDMLPPGESDVADNGGVDSHGAPRGAQQRADLDQRLTKLLSDSFDSDEAPGHSPFRGTRSENNGDNHGDNHGDNYEDHLADHNENSDSDASVPRHPTWAQYGFREDVQAFSSSKRRSAKREEARLADLDSEWVPSLRVKRSRVSAESDASQPLPEIPANRRPSYPMPLGDRVMNLVLPLLEDRIPLNVAIMEFNHARIPGPTGRFLHRLARDLENGVGVVQLFTSHRNVFGDLLVAFVQSGEQTVGTRSALLRYAQLRNELRSKEVNRHHDRIGPGTRRFALTFGALLDVSGDVASSIEGASIEMPRRLRKKLMWTRSRVENGDSLSESLPRRGFLSAGFEPRFIACVGAAVQLSALPRVLRAIAFS
jgi:hypothetical protein